jgi:hypothetical protein
MKHSNKHNDRIGMSKEKRTLMVFIRNNKSEKRRIDAIDLRRKLWQARSDQVFGQQGCRFECKGI